MINKAYSTTYFPRLDAMEVHKIQTSESGVAHMEKQIL